MYETIRDFTNAKGTRYTKMTDRIGCVRDGIWFCLAKQGDDWVAGFVDENRGVETKFVILREKGAPLTALQAYRIALQVYAENISIVSGEHTAETRH